MKHAIKLGADPEFFLIDKKTGRNVSAHDKIPGTKAQPYPMKNGAYIQADGTAVEFNIRPTNDPQDFKDAIVDALDQIKGFVDTKRYKFDFSPVVQYSHQLWRHLPLSATQLGCDPDFNAYLEKQNDPHDPGKYTRTGSGHLHIGFTEVDNPKDLHHMGDCQLFTKALDSTIYPTYKLWEDYGYAFESRHFNYGSPGNFRPKPYGLEYRVLSNAWLKYPNLYPLLFKAVEETFNRLMKGDKTITFHTSSWAARSLLPSSVPAVFKSFNALAETQYE